jgi:hypothetical protein
MDENKNEVELYEEISLIYHQLMISNENQVSLKVCEDTDIEVEEKITD